MYVPLSVYYGCVAICTRRVLITVDILTSTEYSLPLDVPPKMRMSVTARLSLISDWICGPLVVRAARKYSSAICTPDHFVEMLFLVEDKRFSVHLGVDPIAIARAMAFNLRRGSLQGASTIAQQNVRDSLRGERYGQVFASTPHEPQLASDCRAILYSRFRAACKCGIRAICRLSSLEAS